MPGYPGLIVPVDHIEPVPRRIRAMLGGHFVLDTTAARYLWEWSNYPQYYIPLADIDSRYLLDENRTQRLRRGTARTFGLQVGGQARPSSVRVFGDDALAGLAGLARIDWAALDGWYEEDEQVFVHPRDPYTRVDALRSTRAIRVELDGVVLAESSSPVLVFETGLPTRYYLSRTDLNYEHLIASDTQSECPYKGVTSGYWSVQTPVGHYSDLAWAYDFPTRQLLPIAGLVAFYNEKLDIYVDGELEPRPTSHFS
jgi:uncharacterized protein (DUF427 family)